MIKDSGIKVKGHRGSWHVIDTAKYNDETYYLLEHDTWGDEAASVIINSAGELVLEDVWNGFNDLWDYFEREY